MNKKKDLKRTRAIYSNCALYDEKGLLCRCSYQRAHWYVKKGLASVISEQPYGVLLNFDPGVPVEDREIIYAVHKENICCVCGNSDIGQLTRHHIVPFCFRKHFPPNYKSCLSHDVMPVCIDCHTAYHKHATVKIDDMFEHCPEIHVARARKRHLQKTLRICRATSLNTLPEGRQEELIRKLYSQWSTKLTVEEITDRCLKEKEIIKNDAQIYVEQLKMSLDDFVRFWRLDFVETMSPGFLPKGWSLNHKTHNETVD